jgi:hypothetical protein
VFHEGLVKAGHGQERVPLFQMRVCTSR